MKTVSVWWLGWLTMLTHAACDPPRPPAAQAARVASPAPGDRGELCLDLGAIRACWGGDCGEQGCVVPRPLPLGLEPSRGYRCVGQRATRTCGSRADHAGTFRCDAQRCVQRHPRAPDNGEWECVDAAGATHCRKVAEAAGVEPGPLDPGFVCGFRQRRQDGERVCVDFAPDLPAAGRFACSSRYLGGAREWECHPANEPRLGDRCQDRSGCPAGAQCSAGHCLPAFPRPDCWLDSDCAQGRCRFGSCRGDA